MTVVMRTRLCVALVWCALLAQLLVGQATAARPSKLDNWHNSHRIIQRKWQSQAPKYAPDSETDGSSGRFDDEEAENDWGDSGSLDMDAIEFPTGSGEDEYDGSEDDASKGEFSIDFKSELDAELAEFRKIFRHSSDASRTSGKDIALDEGDDLADASRPSVEIEDLPAIRDDKLDKKTSLSASHQLRITSAAAIVTVIICAFVA